MKRNLLSAYQLDNLLLEKYGKDMETDTFATLRGNVEGTYKGRIFHITFKNDEYLLISIDNSGKALLDDLRPILSEVMGDEPICQYDLQTEGYKEEDATPTIEWDIKDPEARVKEIVNGRAFSDRSKLHNLTLFGERKIESYIEDEKAKVQRLANAKIYGIYPGSLKKLDEINNFDEVNLYFLIDSLGGFIWRSKHDASHGRIPEIDLTEEQYAVEYCVYQARKFGVEIPEAEIDKHVSTTPSYWTWFRFYDNHFKNVLTDEEWNAYQQAKREGKDVSKYMPQGNWKDNLEEAPSKKLS